MRVNGVPTVFPIDTIHVPLTAPLVDRHFDDVRNQTILQSGVGQLQPIFPCTNSHALWTHTLLLAQTWLGFPLVLYTWMTPAFLSC